MAEPWKKYAGSAPAAGPWVKYGGSPIGEAPFPGQSQAIIPGMEGLGPLPGFHAPSLPPVQETGSTRMITPSGVVPGQSRGDQLVDMFAGQSGLSNIEAATEMAADHPGLAAHEIVKGVGKAAMHGLPGQFATAPWRTLAMLGGGAGGGVAAGGLANVLDVPPEWRPFVSDLGAFGGGTAGWSLQPPLAAFADRANIGLSDLLPFSSVIKKAVPEAIPKALAEIGRTREAARQARIVRENIHPRTTPPLWEGVQPAQPTGPITINPIENGPEFPLELPSGRRVGGIGNQQPLTPVQPPSPPPPKGPSVGAGGRGSVTKIEPIAAQPPTSPVQAPPAATPAPASNAPIQPVPGAPLGSSAVPANAPTFKHSAPHTDLIRQSHAAASELGFKHADLSKAAKAVYGVDSYSKLSYEQALALHEYMLKNKSLPTNPRDLLPE